MSLQMSLFLCFHSSCQWGLRVQSQKKTCGKNKSLIYFNLILACRLKSPSGLRLSGLLTAEALLAWLHSSFDLPWKFLVWYKYLLHNMYIIAPYLLYFHLPPHTISSNKFFLLEKNCLGQEPMIIQSITRSSVMRVRSDTFGDPIFQKGSQN